MTSDSSIEIQVRRGAALLTASSREPQRDARLLLGFVLRRERAWLLANADFLITEGQRATYQALLEQRVRHEPIQYILGEQEFYGLRFAVSPAVLIPRPETELLVETALARIAAEQLVRIADVGTGSGAIAVALAYHRSLTQLIALDLSPQALQIARLNAEAHGVQARVRFLESDLLGAVRGERFEMIVSNPPYVSAGEALEAQVRDWEPAAALYAGPDGLDVYRRLIPQAKESLLAGGWLLLEIGHGQCDDIKTLLDGWHNVSFVPDLQGIPRVALARRT